MWVAQQDGIASKELWVLKAFGEINGLEEAIWIKKDTFQVFRLPSCL